MFYSQSETLLGGIRRTTNYFINDDTKVSGQTKRYKHATLAILDPAFSY